MILAIKTFPYDKKVQSDGDEAPAQPCPQVEREDQPKPPGLTARRAQLFKTDIEAAGYSEGCPGCRANVYNLKEQAHSEACRKKVEVFLATTPEGRDRLERAGVRIASAGERVEERASRQEQSRTQAQRIQ